MERISTGIEGLDDVLEGGFPNPSSILIVGPTGSGKSLFGLQFLYHGASEYGEPGFMVRTEGYPTDYQWYTERFKWDIAALQRKGALLFSTYDPADFEKFNLNTLHSEVILQLSRVIESIKAKRVVIDAITPIRYSVPDAGKFRTILYYVSRALKEKGCTTLFISEKTGEGLTPFGVEPFVMDGVIELRCKSEKTISARELVVRKMLATSVFPEPYSIDISEDGMRLSSAFFG
jgi:KaiC/GvpD/RAD55 family RecA-like ATPase